HAGGPLSVGGGGVPGARCSLDRIFRTSDREDGMRRASLIGAVAIALAACGDEPDPVQYGPNPDLPEPRRGLMTDMEIPRPAEWGSDRPTVPQGYTIEAIATDLRIPRQTLVLPNGDILVA